MPEINLGNIRGPQGVQGVGIKNLTLKESTEVGNTYTVNLTNSTTGGEITAPKGAIGPQGAVGPIGPQGIQGVGIKNLTLKESTGEGNVYTVHLTNGTTGGEITAPKGAVGPQGAVGAVGAVGPQGVGIKNLTLKGSTDAGNTYTVNLTNGTTGGEITAPKGAVGPQGAVGGVGPVGAQGVGIKSIKYKTTSENGSFVYTVTLTNGVTEDITCPIGPKGDKGDSIKGDKGDPGTPGISPTIIDNLTTDDGTKALSARQGKVLNDTKSNKSDDWRLRYKVIGNTSTNTDLNTILENGFYISQSSNNKITNSPVGGAFELTVTGISVNGNLGPWNYITQIIKSTGNNSMYVRTTSTTQSSTSWGEWSLMYNSANFNPNSKLNTSGGTISGALTVTGNIVTNGSLTLGGYVITVEG